MNIQDRKFVKEFKAKRRNEAILKLLFIILLLNLIVIQIVFAAQYYELIYESVGNDSVDMMLLITPYVSFGVLFALRVIVELFDIDYTFRSYISSLKL